MDTNALLVDEFVASHAVPPKEIILDFDATDDVVHGNQEGRFFHGYYDHYCFLPLYEIGRYSLSIICGSQLLCAYLRPSKIDGAKHAWAIRALLTKRIRQTWPDVKIIFRGDSGFCRWKMLRWCESHGVDYIVGIGGNARLKQFGAALIEQSHAATWKIGSRNNSLTSTRIVPVATTGGPTSFASCLVRSPTCSSTTSGAPP